MARTKVQLTEAVPELGVAGDVCAVARGYARNYLIPNRLAVWASKSALKQADEIRRAGLLKLARLQEEAKAQAEVLNGQRLLFSANAGETGRLYGSITQADIADRIAQEMELVLDRRLFLMDGPLRQLGVFPVRIRLIQDVETFVEVGVVREGETWDHAEAYKAEQAEAERQAAAKAEAASVEDADAAETADAEIQEVLAELDAETIPQ